MIAKALEAVKTALTGPKKVVPITVSALQVAKMRVRPFPGSKKRPVFIMRPTLKRLQSQVDRLNRAARNFRGRLRRTNREQDPIAINDPRKQIAREKASLLLYVKQIQTGPAIKNAATA